MSERRGTKGLELWCKKMTDGYPGVKIDNMTTSWRDGLAFCAIIHHFRPDLIDFSKLNKEDVYYNNDLAFRVAKQYLGIPALLEPEDMVEYAVPDRLSILTYLSQFYQAFAVTQGSGARIAPKRPTQTSPDHGIVSPASTSPPTKMAHVAVGRVRREPCAKCNLPVFIAERLNIGKLLYHRTCFRCARCDSQLTPANYYETENNGFCCEICPDEEKAMTEGSKEKLLQRSLSDEDKSAGLKTFSNDPDDYSAVFETALESTNSEGGEYFQARSKFFRSQLDTPADSGNEEEPPSVPDTDPPDVPDMDPPDVPDTDPPNLSCAKVDSGFPSVNSIVKLSVDVTKDKSIFETKSDTSLVRARMRLFESNDKSSKSDFHRVSQNREAKVTVPIAKLDELENFDDQTNGKLTCLDDNRFDNKKNVKDSAGELVLQTTEDKSDDVSTIEDCKELKIVDAPIVLSRSEASALTDDDKNIRIAIEKEEAIQHIALTNLHNKEMESHLAIKEEAICAEDNVDIEDDIAQHYNESVIVLDNIINDEFSAKSVNPQEDSSIITIDDSPVPATSIREISQHSEPEENNIIIIEDSPVSTVSTREISQVTEPEENNIIVIEDSPISTTSAREISQHSQAILDSSCNTPEQSYPDDLNPFGDNSEDESASNENASPCGVSANFKPKPSPRFRRKLVACEFSPVIKSVQLPSANPFERVYAVTCESEDGPITGTRISCNPFESEEDDSEVKPPQPAARRKKVEVIPRISLNPFGSDDEDEQKNKMPMPTPRLSRVATGVDDKEIGYGTLSLSSRLNYGSNSSISSGSGFGSARKKKPAPRPPISLRTEDSGPNSLASSPSHSVQQSPRVTPKHRKTRKAPPPPTTIFSSTPVSSTKRSDAPNSDSLFRSSMQIPSIPTIPSYPVNNENIELRIHGDDIGKEKNEKDEENRNMQNQDNIHIQISEFPANPADLPVPNKSTYGRWKRKKGQAPSLPIPEKRTIKCLPMSEIKRELDMIEMQQQGLERQGVRLEKIIREKCEGEDAEANTDDIAIDVEDLILQLFELVNEKNELFRKQTELMYLRRQQRLEEEHADVEYQIRKLMLLPEANRTDMDKEREEELIKRLVDIVERRNEIVECLEMDRVREAEEDDSISCHINLFTSKREEEKTDTSVSRKETEKEKKKHKKEKKSKHKCKDKLDIEKDIDESEMAFTTLEKKKKKFKLNLF